MISPRRSGSIHIAWIVLLFIAGGLYLAVRLVNREVSDSRRCKENLRKIFGAIEAYEFNEGRLPNLAFYPKSPLTGGDSLLAVLSSYGLHPSDCVCPASGKAIRDSGLSYLWNPNLNNRPLSADSQKSWMLIEINARNKSLGSPHLGEYHILYTDGEVKSVSAVPYDIPVHD